jgi:hypothetical protein
MLFPQFAFDEKSRVDYIGPGVFAVPAREWIALSVKKCRNVAFALLPGFIRHP